MGTTRQPTLKRGQVTHKKEAKIQPHKSSNLRTTRSQSLAMSTIHTSPAPLVPDRTPSQESPLSPEWIHAITTLMSHLLSSEQGKCIQKWMTRSWQNHSKSQEILQERPMWDFTVQFLHWWYIHTKSHFPL